MIRHVAMTVMLAQVVQGHASSKLAARGMDKLSNSLVGSFFQRALAGFPCDHQQIDSTMLKKPAAHRLAITLQPRRSSESEMTVSDEGECCAELQKMLLEPFPPAPSRQLQSRNRSLFELFPPAAGRQLQTGMAKTGNREIEHLLRSGPIGRAPYSKEMRLLAYVLAHGKKGDPASICQAIEAYGEESLANTGAWLKIAGDTKTDVLNAVVSVHAPKRGSILEVGCYCGYSSIRQAIACPGVRIITLEADPAHMIIARNVIAFAGLDEVIDVWTGHSKDILHRIHHSYKGYNKLRFQGIFKDAEGNQYIEDVDELDDMGLTEKDMLRNAEAEEVVVAEKVWW